MCPERGLPGLWNDINNPLLSHQRGRPRSGNRLWLVGRTTGRGLLLDGPRSANKPGLGVTRRSAHQRQPGERKEGQCRPHEWRC